MTSRRLGFLFVLLASLFAMFAVVRNAHAGTLQIRDQAHVLSAEDAARLRSVIAAAPFDARLVVTNDYPDAQDLSRYVSSLVNEPNMVVVGLDPQHRHVQVHFGTGSRVPRSEFPAIERAGNDAFRRGDWAGGAAAIFQAAAPAAANAPDSAAPAEGARPSLFGPGLLVLVVLGALGVAAYFAWKRSSSGGVGGGPPGYGRPPYGGGPGYPPGYSGPGYPPQGGMGPLGGGLIGAGLGGLAGYELGKMEGEREERDPRRPDEGRGAGGDDPGGNYDEGGGGSSWGDGGDSDGGGGGFDGGGGDGGGSDF
jgi:hypothetical protein